jgi:hypothetical protein
MATCIIIQVLYYIPLLLRAGRSYDVQTMQYCVVFKLLIYCVSVSIGLYLLRPVYIQQPSEFSEVFAAKGLHSNYLSKRLKNGEDAM